MTITATTTTSATTSTPALARDHVISIETAAAELGIQAATVRRYLRAGQLARLGQGVSADGVQAYAATRAANVQRTRFRPAAVSVPARPVEAACAQYSAAADLARQADRGKRAARKTLDAVGPGAYGPWLVELVASGREVVDLPAVIRLFAEHGLGDVPMRGVAASLKVTRTA